jgi:hypothetical protein
MSESSVQVGAGGHDMMQRSRNETRLLCFICYVGILGCQGEAGSGQAVSETISEISPQALTAGVNLTLSASPTTLLANAIATTTLSATFTDPGGRPMTGQNITFLGQNTNMVFSPLTAATNCQGVATTSLLSSRSGNLTAYGTWHGLRLAKANVNFTCTGTLTANSNITTTPNPFSTTLADLNKDGILDLLYVTNSVAAVNLRLGIGNGTFGPLTTPVTGGAPRRAIVADFDGDGNVDIACACYSNNVYILNGAGNGNFQTAVGYASPGNPVWMTKADFNNDGRVDLVVGGNSPNSLTILLNTGTSFNSLTPLSTGSSSFGVAVADLNSDGNQDLIVTDSSGSTLSVFLGNGNATFGARQTYPSTTGPTSVAVADFNLNGTLDVVATSSNSNILSVFYGDGQGSLSSAISYNLGGPSGGVVISDVNVDGLPDLIVLGGGGVIQVLLGLGGSFQASVVPFGPSGSYNRPAVGDINGDGWPDAVVPNYNTGGITTYLNTKCL